MTKMTYTQAIDNALEIIYTALATDPTMWENMDVTAEKLTALKEQLAKRSNGDRKPTKSQVENERVKTEILALLTEEGKQCKDIAETLGISGQKCSALLKQLVDAKQAEKYTEKRVTYFKTVEG